MLNDLNIVEISVDGGNTWAVVDSSDPSILDFWTAISIDIVAMQDREFILVLTINGYCW